MLCAWENDQKQLKVAKLSELNDRNFALLCYYERE